eukprot:5034144-Prymnesium_polylepis.1
MYLPGFASEEECKQLADTWRQTNAYFVPVHRVPRSSMGNETLPEKYDELQRRIMEKTSIKADQPLREAEYYYTAKELPTAGDKFGSGPFEGWHQDHDYWLNLERYHYVNFHLTIEKEDPEDANFGLIPMDAIVAQVPEMPIIGGAAREI